MQLGGAIGPPSSKVLQSALEQAVEDYIRQRGDSAEVLRELLTRLTAITDQLAAATAQMASAASSMAMMGPPVVNVEPPVVNVEPPVVNVTNPEPVVNVTVTEPEEPERGTRKRVVRDAQGLITEIIEEPI